MEVNEVSAIPKPTSRFQYDPETDKIIRIQKDLENNEDLKRVTFESEAFQQEINKEFSAQISKEINT